MKQILIIGAGFAGLWSALSAIRQLDLNGSKGVEVTLLAPQAELHVRPRFYEPDVHTMAAPLQALFDAVNVRFVQGTAYHIDEAARRVGYRTRSGTRCTLPYDRLIMACGSELERPDMVGIEHAFDVDKLDSAARLEAHLKSLASLPNTPARNTVVVAGGGFTGIETATELPARLRAILGEDAALRIVVIDRGARIGAALGDGIRPAIEQACEALGVEWVCGATVVSVDPAGVQLDNGQRIDASTVVWTVGFKANPLTEQISGERDNRGRLHVDGNLKVKGNDAVYAAGDVAYATCDELGNHAVMSCQHAIALGRHAGNNAAAELLGVAPTAYSQPKYVTCLDLGAWGAVYTEGWDREVSPPEDKAEAKALKRQINSVWIYPPAADRASALAAADPLIPVA
ncbi:MULTISPECIES: NAD(P)/FAD-dependent oxidoreductase [Pseudomonas]|jgi:NADH dehydrogenase|uniref:Pyridine nucleotide-disulphide oxidoreductase family protein n=2 Tax=Pseudomonas putida group TaxID=136845 RepID=Q88IY2_PSEPK|nr:MULTISPECIES: NAD(P)/FAD-dependent oxidoreductase [Pseudomonas]AAN68475.1 Pyridine nucleotide-disulphide oxidoreductase family protein [Pseudomonas putida KT2440]KMU97850.1 pyridine nucleotide-disulfide oxidoreductase [Pseudomonas putida]KMY35135.1 pyridine nucleotide-disulfide oxidoreductase [Pseudomonas putida]MBP2839037.1 NAD(P)/FAD-dependent oxidoreductase [Pseudomonas sp. PNP]MCE0860120.1 NAD(P)/FAD-dependent oxidoreductase [Pseudomonas alloputida]